MENIYFDGSNPYSNNAGFTTGGEFGQLDRVPAAFEQILRVRFRR
jgi:hypothetical protein